MTRQASRSLALRSLLVVYAVGVCATVANAQTTCGGDPTSADTVRCVASAQWAAVKALPPPASSELCGVTRLSERLEILVSDAEALASSKARLMLPDDFAPIDTSVPGSEAKVRSVFHGESYEVQLITADGVPPGIPATVCFIKSSLAATLDQTATAVSGAVRAYNQPMLVDGAAALERLSDTWQWIITDGFGQFPWERAVSDAFSRSRVSPYDLPKAQLVLAHPSVGTEVSGGKRFTDFRNRASFFFEPIGFVRYRFNVPKSSHSYWGLSALLVLNADQAPGVGGLIRMNKFALGAVRHMKDARSGEPARWAVTATVELLERVQSARKKLTDAAADAKKKTAAPVDGSGGL